MDYDGDGTLDMISGSYDPGDLYLFRGLGKGKYAARQLLRDENDVPLVHHPKELVKYHAFKKEGTKAARSRQAIGFRVASFGSWPAMVDWDADGDLDVLIGSFGGKLYLRINKGTRTQPRFAAESVQVEVKGQPLGVYCHADPVVADWDADGRWDLVIGSGDGSVWFFKNVGEKNAPEFAAGQVVVPATSESKFKVQYLKPGEPMARGARSQICVTDYNGDGKLDLLVGDYSNVYRQRPNLDEDERAELAKILAQDGQAIKGQDSAARSAAAKAKRKLFKDEGRQSYVWLFLRR